MDSERDMSLNKASSRIGRTLSVEVKTIVLTGVLSGTLALATVQPRSNVGAEIALES